MDEQPGMPQAGSLEQRAMTGWNPSTCDQEVSPRRALVVPSRELGDAEPQDERDTAAEIPSHGANMRGVKVRQKVRQHCVLACVVVYHDSQVTDRRETEPPKQTMAQGSNRVYRLPSPKDQGTV